jgi:hypothetical protein
VAGLPTLLDGFWAALAFALVVLPPFWVSRR